jgi:hypothetical protein
MSMKTDELHADSKNDEIIYKLQRWGLQADINQEGSVHNLHLDAPVSLKGKL